MTGAARPLEGRTAIVTGASSGIGEATAALLAARGAKVVCAARNVERLDAVTARIRADGGEALAVPTDVTDPAALAGLVTRATDTYGPLHILVCNAGNLPPARRAEKLPRAEWQATLDLNVTAPWELASIAKPYLQAPGAVVMVTSTAARYPTIGLAAYCASKAALEAVTRVLALEWARDGIRVVSVAPGKIDTELVQPILRYSERKELALNPLGRIGSPAEAAGLIGYLVSDEAAYITGSSHVIDGGELLSPR